MKWHARPRFLLFDECPGIAPVLPGGASEPPGARVEAEEKVELQEVAIDHMEVEREENVEAKEVAIDYMEVERRRIVAEQLVKKQRFAESCARAQRIKQERKEREEARTRKREEEESVVTAEMEMRLPEGSRCRKCKGRVQYGIKMKYGCRDRNRGHAVCNGECFLKEMRRSARCKVCRKDIIQGTSDRKFCNGMCTAVGTRRKMRRSKS
jgi:hypothetical protein